MNRIKVLDYDFRICHRLTTFSRFFIAREGLNMVFYKGIRAQIPSGFPVFHLNVS